MELKNIRSPIEYKYFGQLSLLHFGLEISDDESGLKSHKIFNGDRIPCSNSNKFERFIESTYNYSRVVLNRYSSRYSKHSYSQPALFTILALKFYLKATYREIVDIVDSNDKLKSYLGIKKAPNYSTLQKFFKRIPTKIFHSINDLIIKDLDLKPETIAMDGSGFVSSNADFYYSTIIQKTRKRFTKCHITADVDTGIILHNQAIDGPRHDMTFAMAAIKK